MMKRPAPTVSYGGRSVPAGSRRPAKQARSTLSTVQQKPAPKVQSRLVTPTPSPGTERRTTHLIPGPSTVPNAPTITSEPNTIEKSGQELEEAMARHRRNLEEEVKSKTKALDKALESIKAKDKSILKLEAENRDLESRCKKLQLDKNRLSSFVARQRDIISTELTDLVPGPTSSSTSTSTSIAGGRTDRASRSGLRSSGRGQDVSGDGTEIGMTMEALDLLFESDERSGLTSSLEDF